MGLMPDMLDWACDEEEEEEGIDDKAEGEIEEEEGFLLSATSW